MINQLIEEGKALARFKSKGVLGTDRIDGVEYETWAAKVIMVLEKEHKNSLVTQEAKKLFTSDGRYAYNIYERLLGAVIAVKEIKS